MGRTVHTGDVYMGVVDIKVLSNASMLADNC